MRRIVLAIAIALTMPMGMLWLITGTLTPEQVDLTLVCLAAMVVLNTHRILAAFIRSVRSYL